MNLPFKKNTSIAIAGFGIEGKGVFDYLKKHNYSNINIFDEKKQEEGIINVFDFDSCECEVIFRSPGIHKDHPALRKARNQGKFITSATKLFFDICPCKIIGVTGTKGKGTTSTLIYKILQDAGEDVYIGGNIGQCPLTFIDSLNENSIVVLELSSFQLHDLNKSPHIAVVLNTTSEHLDYHKNQKEYLDAKTSIVKYQTKNDMVVVNADYEYHKHFLSLTNAKEVLISRTDHLKNGVCINGEKIIISKNRIDTPVCKIDEIGLTGKHNLENIMPSTAVAHFLSIPISNIRKIIKTFKGLPHRLELIKQVNKIQFYNDSFSTTPETCIAAIQSFKKPLVLIAGGSEKYSDYSKLGEAIIRQPNLKSVVLMGETADRIEKSIIEASKKLKSVILQKIIRAKTYEKAFKKAFNEAQKGSVVLLSPASASFDMFKNYKHRGNTYRKWVESL